MIPQVIFGFWFQDSRNDLELASIEWFQYVGYFYNIFVLILRTFGDVLNFWTLESRIPGFQDSRSALELASFDWFQHVGYFSQTAYVKKVNFQHIISKFHNSWKVPGIYWNSGFCLEMANFLPILTYWVSIQLSFCHWTRICSQKLKNVMPLVPFIILGFWIKWHLKKPQWPCIF